MEAGLGAAIVCKDLELVGKILSKGIDPNIPQTTQKIENAPPICLAATTGNVEIAKMLLDKGANINTTSVCHLKISEHRKLASCLTSLSWAIHCKHNEMVAFLLSRNADPNIQTITMNPHLPTAIFWAAKLSNLRATEMLLAHSTTDVTVINDLKQTAADVAKDETIKNLIASKFHERKYIELKTELPELKLKSINEAINEKNDILSGLRKQTENMNTKIAAFKVEIECLTKEKASRKRPYQIDETLLECPYCCEIPSTIMLQCRNGHQFCNACTNKPTMDSCPACQVPLDREQPIRCLLIEKMIAHKMGKVDKPTQKLTEKS